MRNPNQQPKNESSNIRRNCGSGSSRRPPRPTMRFYKSCDEISTLKENAIKNLRKELTHTKQYRFSKKVCGKLFEQKMTEIYSVVYHLAATYNLEPNSYGLFDKIFRNFAMRHLKAFLTIITDKSDPRSQSKNVGTNDKNLTDSQLIPEFFANSFEESMDAFDLKMRLLHVNAFVCLRLVMKYEENQQDLLTPAIAKISSTQTSNSYPS